MQRSESETPVPDPRVYINALRPPIGTSFFISKDTLVFDNVLLGNPKALRGFLMYVNLSVQAYSYASGANPKEPGFAEKGGVIHVILVLDGDMEVKNNDAVRWDSVDVEITAADGFRPSLHQPATGDKEGGIWTYDIHYEEMLPMFKNMGNEPFNFHAKFQDMYKRVNIEEKGSWNTSSCKIRLQPNPQSAAMEKTHKVHALSVFRTTSLLDRVARFNFKFHVRPAGVTDDERYYVTNKALDVSVGFT